MNNVHTYFFMVNVGLNLGSLHAGETLLTVTVFSYHAQLGNIAVVQGKKLKPYGPLLFFEKKHSEFFLSLPLLC